MKGPVREIVPVGEQTVEVRLPDGVKPRKVQLLVSGRTPRVEESPGRVRVAVPSVGVHEVVAIDV
jgi:hypothetical protein